MSIPVLTAVSDPRWEADLVAALTRDEHGVTVVRRCVDLADLLAAAAAGLARAVVLSEDLRRLDREALTRLSTAGVAVVGLVVPADEAAERRLRQLGVADVLPADAAPATIAEAVLAAVAAVDEQAARPADDGVAERDWADVAAAYPRPPQLQSDTGEPEVTPGSARVIAVWGPAGAPGRSFVAANLAAELGELGVPTLLVDADVYGGVQAQLLGVLDESPGLAAACRLAGQGTLDAAAMSALTLEVRPGLRLLTGIVRADRWPELRASGIDAVLAVARSVAAVTVVDCAFCLELDEELAFDTAAPRRNGATLAVLDAADEIVAVAAADPVGLQRYVRAVAELREAVPTAAPVTVVNKLRNAAVGGGDAEAQIAAALDRYAGIRDVRFVPYDVSACDTAVAQGRALVEVAPGSPARQAVQAVAAGLAGQTVPRRRRGLARRRR